MNIFWVIVVAVLALLAAGILSATTVAVSSRKAGEPLLRFTLVDLRGRQHTFEFPQRRP